MKMLFTMALFTLVSSLIFAQASTSSSKDKSTVSQLEKETIVKIQSMKKAIIDSVNSTKTTSSIKEENHYGDLVFKGGTAKIYDFTLGPIETNDYKKWTDEDKAKLKKNQISVDPNAQFRFVKIDSIKITIKRNIITRIILYSGANISYTNVRIEVSEIAADSNKVTSPSPDTPKTYLKMVDLFQLIPDHDDDNIASGSFTLSTSHNIISLKNH